MANAKSRSVIPIERIAAQIYLIRGQSVMLDADLASLYGVETKNLNKAVSRNQDRFPDDFMFHLTTEEWDALRFQIGTSNTGRGGRRYAPRVFTEQGVAMLSSVLRSKRAASVNVAIMRTFVRMRRMLTTTKSWPARWPSTMRKSESYSSTSKGCWSPRNRRRNTRSGSA